MEIGTLRIYLFF